MKRAPTVLTLTLPCSAAFWGLYVPYFGTNVVRDELEPILRVRAAIRAKYLYRFHLLTNSRSLSNHFQ